MSTGSGGKPGGSQPGRPAADTPERLVVRSDADTAVAMAQKKSDLGMEETGIDPDTGPVRRSGSDSHVTSSGGSGASAMPEVIGTTLSGRYLVTRKIGQGGMGAVYEATHTIINKRVAVKVLLEKYAQREALVKRLKQEAQLASSVDNEHIISVTDFGTTEDGRTFVVMEYLDGESLAECLTRETQLSEQRILRIVSQAASALAAAHAKGIVHRDIKPENLFILRRKDADFVKVVDFGISKSLRASGEEEETTRLTQTGMVLGTPLYMSPEQARGDDELDHRVDVYALGVIMYEASTGRVPFIGNNYLSVISQVLNEEPKALRELRPELSEEFEAVVLKAMSKDVNDRYASANDMLADVNLLLEDPTHSTERAKITGPRRRIKKGVQPSSSRYAVWIGGIAVVVAAVIFSVTQLVGSTKNKPTEPVAGGSGSAIVVAASVPDAGVKAAVVETPSPETKFITITIQTIPKGATIFLDGLEKGDPTPTAIRVVRKEKDIVGFARLAGYNDYEFKLNPMEHDEKDVLRLKLVKPPKGTPVKTVKPSTESTPQGSQDTIRQRTSGEISGDPFQGSGTVPKK
ncbi:MAG: serine/threonine protein kinase [Deltaproteobacteria bacterium]|nr:serine/threonine protein kinase [Deltaproteobacteria bacterium]